MLPRATPKFQYPKRLPELNLEQRAAREDFMRHWHEVLPKRYGLIERFNHVGAFGWPVKNGCRTLEIGAGLGAHLEFEDLGRQSYTANELRPEMASRIQERFPQVKLLIGDIQEGLDCRAGSFDRVIAVHVLEHLPDLPRALSEIDRLLAPGGVLQAVLPCEGGVAYGVARRISAQRIFERRYRMPYGPIIANEHVSVVEELDAEIGKRFDHVWSRFFPFPFLRFYTANLVVGTMWRSRKAGQTSSITPSS
jgi:SAM-dependent methyltransferase